MTLVIQFLTGPLIVVYTVMSQTQEEQNILPALAISFKEYLKTVTIIENGAFAKGSNVEKIFQSYQESFKALTGKHKLELTSRNFRDEILNHYKVSIPKTSLNFMIGASFKSDSITAWFNNQAFHTAPLAVNTLNNAILR